MIILVRNNQVINVSEPIKCPIELRKLFVQTLVENDVHIEDSQQIDNLIEDGFCDIVDGTVNIINVKSPQEEKVERVYEVPEKEVGEVFEFEGVILEVVKSLGCSEDAEESSGRRCYGLWNDRCRKLGSFSPCFDLKRKDKTGVCFVRVIK